MKKSIFPTCVAPAKGRNESVFLNYCKIFKGSHERICSDGKKSRLDVAHFSTVGDLQLEHIGKEAAVLFVHLARSLTWSPTESKLISFLWLHDQSMNQFSKFNVAIREHLPPQRSGTLCSQWISRMLISQSTTVEIKGLWSLLNYMYFLADFSHKLVEYGICIVKTSKETLSAKVFSWKE